MASRIKAPLSWETDATVSFLGHADAIFIQPGALLVQIWFFLEGTGQVAGTIKLRIGEGATIEGEVVAGGKYQIQVPTGCDRCLPVIELDGKTAAGEAKMTIVVI